MSSRKTRWLLVGLPWLSLLSTHAVPPVGAYRTWSQSYPESARDRGGADEEIQEV